MILKGNKMVKRSRNWDESLANRLKDTEYAAEFLLALIEEGENLQNALSTLIKSYGVTEYADLAGIQESNIHRAIDPEHNPTQKTLETLLKPLGLTLSVKKEDDVA